ncbi:conserved hypothetical protein [Candidatus Desulfarcum epimagneticum]|uniref:Polymerase nucleotidyl transferase domain-containing protein n=1 Tax=uncultured Desulfobacteraceae bacterium TaxID=218296 RepID=A0A484HNY6_9BACT|nr:conserved hypothetical protein [uncultured Desulfobacteraceae bacterium]
MRKEKLLKRVKNNVLEIEPGAEIILYGSRARLDSREYSDWDFLILVDGDLDSSRTDAIRHKIYEVEWESGEVLSSIVRSRREWGNPHYRVMPFYRNVARDGIRI